MSGYSTVLMVDRIRNRAAALGFMLAYPKYGRGDGQDLVGIRPLDDQVLPIYTRDAEFFTGTLQQLDSFLTGIEWAREYDRMLHVSDTKRRERKEQDFRNRELVRILKGKNESNSQS
jgi:hypothetical protein